MIVSSLPPNSFLSDVRVYEADPNGHLNGIIGAAVDKIAQDALQSGVVQICSGSESEPLPAIAIPVLRDSSVVCVVVLVAKSHAHELTLSGVFEAWAPVGVFEELSLHAGFFGRMERFQNVSSFVRFEKGSGLPGQVWERKQSVIHNDLPNHPGFLRAAGASADSLATAIGIPVASTAYHGTAVLISSTLTPIARAMEVWDVKESSFALTGSAYREFDESVSLPSDAIVSGSECLMAKVAEAGTAILCDEVPTLFVGRNADAKLPESASGLGIPFFQGEKLTSITTLIF